MVAHWHARVAGFAQASASLAAAADAGRQRPTPANRLPWFVERHFIACLLVFFFLALPLGAQRVAWLAEGAR